ncbi:glycoside hydrolase family 6 protein [Nonomuraea ferruginea]
MTASATRSTSCTRSPTSTPTSTPPTTPGSAGTRTSSPRSTSSTRPWLSTAAGVDSVDGFIVNTANYSGLREPHYTINTTVNGTSVRQSTWVDWNWYIGEASFATALRNALIAKGFRQGLGMLVDTSRNGWGGTARPGAASTSTNVNTFVNESRIDRRIHA